jgi:spermidine synthase
MARYAPLFLLFFLSGISGLIYESIWSRYIKLFVGSAATAQVLVLSLFMGGMALGSLLASRRLARLRAPVRAYGLIEGGIGLYALAFPWLSETAIRLCYDHVFPGLGGGLGVDLVKWSVAGLLILPPCVLLGMTFPLMSAGILRRDPERSGEILSFLYFTNSIGAALGALLSGFLLVARFGLPGTLACAAALNIAIAAVALAHRERHPPIVEDPAASSGTSALVRLLLLVSFGTGLSSFMYEIGWIRLLSMIIGSATHSFEVMLSAFVFGLAIGGLWVRKRMDRFRRPELVLGLVQLVMGVAAVATLPAYQWAVQAIGWLLVDAQGARTEALWLQFNLLRYALCLLIMFPATFCAGMTLPLITHVLLRRGQAEGVIGRVYGFNTFGAIAGSILAGLVLMPLLGLQRVIVLGAAVDVALGLALVFGEARRPHAPAKLRRFSRVAAGGSLVALALGLFVVRLDPMVLSATVFRNGRTRLSDSFELLSYVDGRTASVSVVRLTDDREYRVIYTNGKPDASVVLNRYPDGRDPELGPDFAGDEPNQVLVGLLPLMARPDAADVALIGFGSGVTAHVLLGSPALERLDTIEIEPEMVEGSRHFYPANARAYDDPRNRFWFDDAKAYFAGAARHFDIIISEPTNPWVSGVSSLFTVEFYREAKRYLKPGGILAQWLQGYELSDDLLLTVLAALDQEFSDYQILRVGASDWVILSVADGELGQLREEPLAWAAMQPELALLGVHSMGQVDNLIVANRRMLRPFLAGRPANSDAMPLLDTGAEKARFLKESAAFLHRLRWTPAPLLEALGGLTRRPYPPQGIGDRRDPHVFEEAETAVAQLRFYADPTLSFAEGVSLTPMNQWIEAQRRIEAGLDEWDPWIERTYGVYINLVPHVQLSDVAWWQDVLATARDHDAPAEVRLFLAALDALQARDGARLLAHLERLDASGSLLLTRGMRAIAGMVARELSDAPPASRRAWAEREMVGVADGEDRGERLAFEALQAYAAR